MQLKINVNLHSPLMPVDPQDKHVAPSLDS